MTDDPHDTRVAACLETLPEDVPGVVAKLDELQALCEAPPRGPTDGLACFNHLYHEITVEVLTQLDAGETFDDPEFLGRLDVEFARRYFAAVRADALGTTVPNSWQVLLRRRADPEVSAMQFAVAGVNAHVNYDLALAVVRTCVVLGRNGPGEGERNSYQAVDTIFAHHMRNLRRYFDSPVERAFDHDVLAQVADEVGDLSVVLSRDAAWRRAEYLWTLRACPEQYDRESGAIDWRAAFLGRGILSC